MPPQVIQTGLLAKLGGKFVTAHNQNKDALPDLGSQSIPPGINGIAELVECKLGTYKEGNNAGKTFAYMAGVSILPEYHLDPRTGATVKGPWRTAVTIPLCDTPTSGGKRKTFDDNYAYFLAHLKGLGFDVEAIEETDPVALEAAIVAGMDALKSSDPPVTFAFETRQGKPTKEYPDPRVFESWYGACPDPRTESPEDAAAAGVKDDSGDAHASRNGTAPKAPANRVQSAPAAAPKPGPGKPTSRPAPEPEPDAGEDDGLDVLVDAANGKGKPALTAQAEIHERGVAAGLDEDWMNATDTTWEEIRDAIREAGGSPAEDAAGDTAADDSGPPKKGEWFVYRPRDAKGNPGKRAVEVSVTNVYPKGRSADLRNEEDKKTVYKTVPWDHLEQAGA